MKRILSLFIISVLTILSCTDDITEFNISGQIIFEGLPIENADVYIDKEGNFQVETDVAGYFQMEKVIVGEHLLIANKNFDSGIFVRRSFEIDVSRNADFGPRHLPKIVDITSFVFDSATNTASMRWDTSRAADFKEYIIYSYPDSSLFADSAQTIFVSTKQSDTAYDYVMPSRTTLFFRLITMSELGELGGSRVFNATSISANLLQYGNFENEEGYADLWSSLGYVDIQDSIFYEGNKALLLNSRINVEDMQWAKCILYGPGFAPGKDDSYLLSFRYKARGLAHMEEGPFKFHYKQNSEVFLETTIGTDWWGQDIPNTPFRLLSGVDWSEYSTIFTPNSDSTIYFEFSATIDELYLDDIRCEKVSN